MAFLLLFVDGIGLGRRDPAANVFLRARMPHLEGLLGGQPLVAGSLPATGPRSAGVPVDATLGVPGIPQSATGQTAILTGVNAPRAIGRHLNGYPTPRLRQILMAHSLFKRIRDLGRTATFLNAYRPEFFRWLEATGGDPDRADEEVLDRIFNPAGAAPGSGLPPGWSARAARRYRPSASTVAVLAAGLPFRTLDDLAAGEAVYHDITRATLRAQGYPIPLRAPEEAGADAARVARRYDFAMFEYFLTDLAGHAQDPDQAVAVLETWDRFLGGVLAGLDPDRDTVLILSDHGNLEDLAVRTHTRNPVPAIAWGAGAQALVGGLRDLTDVAGAILSALGLSSPPRKPPLDTVGRAPDEPHGGPHPSKG